MGLAVVTRIPSYVEAQIAAGALRSAGIAAEVFDGNFGQVEAPVIQSLGGFRIMAPEEEVAAARDVLRSLRAGPGLGEPDEDGPWASPAPSKRTSRTKLIASLILGVPLLLWLGRLLFR
jgi:hypothetical protein